jgi:hypothetical protein
MIVQTASMCLRALCSYVTTALLKHQSFGTDLSGSSLIKYLYRQLKMC